MCKWNIMTPNPASELNLDLIPASEVVSGVYTVCFRKKIILSLIPKGRGGFNVAASFIFIRNVSLHIAVCLSDCNVKV